MPKFVHAVALAASLAMCATASPAHAVPDEGPRLQRYTAANKATLGLVAPAGERVLEVKFAHRAPVRVANNRAEAKQPALAASGALAALRSGRVERVEPLFALDEGKLAELRFDAQSASGVEQSDLSQWLKVTAKSDHEARELAEELNKHSDVEVAYVRPRSRLIADQAPAIAADEDLTKYQGYRRDPQSSYGINAEYANTIEGGAGKGVTIGDTEVGWPLDHPDLSKLTAKSVVTIGTPKSSGEFHGASVMGELVADKNGFGVTGIAYDATPIVSHAITEEKGFDPANGLLGQLAVLKKGDVMVVELQTEGCKGPGSAGNYVAEEWIPSVYDVVKTATSRGIHVIEAAGNGGENLDAQCYGKKFPNDREDSGAIIVGAGAGKDSTGRNRYCGTIGDRQIFSSYGTRVNSFAWGLCVTTTDVRGYTNGFSGTSSATPIVAGAVASLSGIAKARGLDISPARMRDLVTRTGTPSSYGAGIGTMPDLKRAIAELDSNPGPTPTPTKPAPTPTPTPKPTPSATPTPSASPTPTATVSPTPTTSPAPVGGEIAVTNDNLAEVIEKSRQQPVIFVVGANWSGMTKELMPKVRGKLQADSSSWTLAYVDGALYKTALARFGVSGYPTVIAYSDGVELTSPARFADGRRSQEGVDAFVNDAVAAWKAAH